jgi:protein-glutamine gamma-glutamyltransferase
MTTLRTPPLLLGAALLFWGWQSGMVLVGALLAVVLESSRVVGIRWELEEKDFRRLWDFTVFLFVGVTLYLVASNETPQAVASLLNDPSPSSQNRVLTQTAKATFLLFRWSPAIFFLFTAAQAYSSQERIPWRVFSPFARRRSAGRKATPASDPRGANTAYPYFAICLAAASIPLQPSQWFFAGFAGLLVWALWYQRSPRVSAAVWASLLALILTAGFFAQRGFYDLAGWANLQGVTWLAQFFTGTTDPKESRTAIGSIGRVKLSGKIVLRVQPKEGWAVPSLLREASYWSFNSPFWASAGQVREFQAALAETNQTVWELAPQKKPDGAVTIAQYLTGHGEDARRGLLALPHGIVRLENLPAFLTSTNRLGVVRVDEGPGLVIYDAYYRKGSTIDAPPSRDDLGVPLREDATLSQVAAELQLAGKSTEEILRAVSAFFFNKFQYSVWLSSGRRSQTNLTPLGNFLLHERAGHCEYFATAAALLLRKAGVPARYAVGYAVQERSGGKYIVRERHAHAWCLAWVDGAWRDFDVTPPGWFAEEARRASWSEWISDAASRLWFEFSKWRWGQTSWRPYIFWALGPLLVLLLIRLFFGKQWKRLRQRKTGGMAGRRWPGLDSEFYQLERELGRRGLFRQANETPFDWLERLRDHPLLAGWREPLVALLNLHYRYRFDPTGLDAQEREDLRSRVTACLQLMRGGTS